MFRRTNGNHVASGDYQAFFCFGQTHFKPTFEQVFLQNDSTLVLSGLLFLNARLRQIILVRVLGPFATQSHARLSRFWYLKLVSSVQAGGGNLGVGGGSYGFVVGTTEG
mmetsp:Transcript_4915/g.10358  ORF Transcript_4915/g.10358 Transcript_4915/m.10358 type:complete len:109 (-) Transcript_4915:35-361(-)